MAEFYSLVTKKGKKLIAQAVAESKKLSLTQIAVGDGGGNVVYPTESQDRLRNEVKRWDISSLVVEDDIVTIRQTIAPEDGGFYTREIGVYDADNNLVIVGNCPPSYKPLLEQGSDKTQVICIKLVVSNASVLEMVRDFSKVIADQQWVISYLDTELDKHKQSVDHPKATLTEWGFTKLSHDIDSESQDHAATIGCVTDLSKKTTTKFEDINKNITSIQDNIEYISQDLKTKLSENGGDLGWAHITNPSVVDVWANPNPVNTNIDNAGIRHNYSWGIFTGEDRCELRKTTNLTFASWWGVGFAPLYNGQQENVNCTVTIDTRAGTINAKGGVFENNTRVVTEGRYGLGACWLPYLQNFYTNNNPTGMYWGTFPKIEQPSSVTGQPNNITGSTPDPNSPWTFTCLVQNAHGNHTTYFVTEMNTGKPRCWVGATNPRWEGLDGKGHMGINITQV